MADMTLVGFTCPVDGLALTTATATRNRDDTSIRDVVWQEATARGGHVHVIIPDALSCLNGHVWRISPFIMERS